jgi:AbrB family looped-hinge helix DNA binding protein
MPYENAIIGFMQVSIDKAGRIVVPKPVRDRLGLQPESRLELVENDQGFQLKPLEARARLVRRPNGRLMIAGPMAPGTDWKNIVRNMRGERIRKIAGR